MADIDMRSLARTGAQARLEQLRAEMASIKASFPDLASTAVFRDRDIRSPVETRPTKRGERRSTMTTAQRKAASERMKKYWATRRGQGGAAKTAAKQAASKKRTMSPAARKKIAAAQKKRWAAIRKGRSAAQ